MIQLRIASGDRDLPIQDYPDVLSNDALKPAVLCQVVDRVRESYRIRGRHGCRLLQLTRSTNRHQAMTDEQAALRLRLKELAGSSRSRSNWSVVLTGRDGATTTYQYVPSGISLSLAKRLTSFIGVLSARRWSRS